jgi:ADP-heptose:LPS heptosyltransferase
VFGTGDEVLIVKVKSNSIKSEDQVCIIRSAFLGDWVTTLPFICYLIYECKVKKENIHFLIINNQGTNPVTSILGEESVISTNTYALNSSSIRTFYSSVKKARLALGKKINKVILLPFTHDNAKSILKKRLLSTLIFKGSIDYFGFSLKKPKNLSESQYSSYFNRLNISYSIKKESIAAFLKEEGFLLQKKYSQKKQIAIYANSKLEMKIWPLQNFISLINTLSKEHESEFYLIGGKEDVQFNSNLMQQLPGHVTVNILAGKLTIKDTINFLSNMDLLVANDGAPIHFAAMVNTPIVGLYTYKEPVGSWDPYLTSSFITYRADVSCKHCFKEHCPNPVCLYSINVQSVVEASNFLLNNSSRHTNEVRLLFSKQPLNYLDYTFKTPSISI